MNADTASRSPSDGRRRGRSAEDGASAVTGEPAVLSGWESADGALSPVTGGSSRPANGLTHFVPTVNNPRPR